MMSHGFALWVVAAGWDGFGDAVGVDADLPLVALAVFGGFDQGVVVVAQQDQVR